MKIVVVLAQTHALAEPLDELVLVGELRHQRAAQHDRRLVQTGDDADAAGKLVEEHRVGLRGKLGQSQAAVQPRREDLAAALDRPPHEAQVHVGEDVGDVEGRQQDVFRRAHAAAVQLVAELQQVHLADGFVVDQLHGVSGLGHALDFHPLPAADADVDVLAAGADAGAHAAGAPRHQAAEQDGVADFLGRDQLGAGDGFRQRHPQAVGAPDDAVALVLHLAAGVLFERDVGDREIPALEGQRSR